MVPLPPERLLMPFGAGPFRMAMGLQSCPSDELVEIDDRYPAEMAERRDLLATRRDEVFGTTPGSETARAETLALLAEMLPRRHLEWFGRDRAVLRNHLTSEVWDLDRPAMDPLELAGRLVQEDLVIIDATGPAPVFVAAVLCAPSRWRLHEKLGRPLDAVHGAVPLYQERLSDAVDRFMGALKPGRVAERQNWSVVDDGALFQPGGKFRTGINPAVTAANAPDTLFLRVERQTFMRLPASGAVLFAIRVHSYPLRRVIVCPGAPRELAGAVRSLPHSIGIYKSLPTIQDALLACLDAAGA